MEVPTGALALGVPAKLREGAANQEMIELAAQSYVDRSRRYREQLRRLD
jgi:carbonic anhydrase/acetyltransferase-like protein (isoleucine patch superfamily)